MGNQSGMFADESTSLVYRDRYNRVIKSSGGFTVGAWKSLAIKSLRMGWPAGLSKATEHLDRKQMQSLLIGGLFEDVFPAQSELTMTLMELERRDYQALCRRQTLHGRGYAEQYCGWPDPPVPATAEITQIGKSMGLGTLKGAAFLNFNAWLGIAPQDAGVVRSLDQTPWTRMPAAMLDAHTPEGREKKVGITLLSGSVDQHRELGKIVMESGWEWVREQVHQSH